MFAGHVGAALVLGRLERRVNIGVFVLASLLLDVLLWLFILLGWESATLPANFATTHQPEFVFPYSHGLFASVCWSALAGATTLLWYPRWRETRLRTAALVAAAAFSHWLLDALVHVPELPLTGADSVKLGLGLWQSMALALALEACIVLVGLWLFVPGAGLPRFRKRGMIALSLLLLAFTVVGMTVASPPPSVTAMALSSLVTIMVVCTLTWWLGRPPLAHGS